MEKNTRHSTFIKYINYPFSNLYFFVKPYTSNAHALGPGPNNSTGDPYHIVVLFEKEIVIPDLHIIVNMLFKKYISSRMISKYLMEALSRMKAIIII